MTLTHPEHNYCLQVLAWLNSDTWNKGDFIKHENETEVYKATPEANDRMPGGPQRYFIFAGLFLSN